MLLFSFSFHRSAKVCYSFIWCCVYANINFKKKKNENIASIELKWLARITNMKLHWRKNGSEICGYATHFHLFILLKYFSFWIYRVSAIHFDFDAMKKLERNSCISCENKNKSRKPESPEPDAKCKWKQHTCTHAHTHSRCMRLLFVFANHHS